MAKMGRPKSDNPKAKQVTVRLDKEHEKILEDYCKKYQIEKAKAIRQGIRKLKE